MSRTLIGYLAVAAAAIVVVVLVAARGSSSPQGGGLRVVAAENFYGNIAAQIGGSRVSVTSILSYWRCVPMNRI